MVMKRTPIAVILAYSICHTFFGCEGMCRACPIAQTCDYRWSIQNPARMYEGFA